MKCGSAIGADVETGLATDTSFFIRHDRLGFRNALPGTSRTDRNAGGLLTLLTDNGHEDRNLFPFLYLYPGKGRATGTLMGKAADHFAGLTSCAAFRDDGDGTHLDDLLRWFFIVNTMVNDITQFLSLSSTFCEYAKNSYCKIDNMFIIENEESDPLRWSHHEMILWDSPEHCRFTCWSWGYGQNSYGEIDGKGRP
jgi:hypothetical protein